MKACIACGMVMNKITDYAMNDSSKDYCKYCAHLDGSMQSYEEKRQSMADFIINTQGFDITVALQIAESRMKSLPAWVSYLQAEENL